MGSLTNEKPSLHLDSKQVPGRLAPHPALIVHPPREKDTAAAALPPRRHILCPVSYSEVERSAFDLAVSVSPAFEARLTVVCVVEEAAIRPEELERAEELLRVWLPSNLAPRCDVQPIVRHGSADEQTLAPARETAADLVPRRGDA